MSTRTIAREGTQYVHLPLKNSEFIYLMSCSKEDRDKFLDAVMMKFGGSDHRMDYLGPNKLQCLGEDCPYVVAVELYQKPILEPVPNNSEPFVLLAEMVNG